MLLLQSTATSFAVRVMKILRFRVYIRGYVKGHLETAMKEPLSVLLGEIRSPALWARAYMHSLQRASVE